MVVMEAASKGVPSVVASASPTTPPPSWSRRARTGSWPPRPRPADLAAAIVRVHEAGPELRERTAAWFEANARRLSLAASLETVLESYRQ